MGLNDLERFIQTDAGGVRLLQWLDEPRIENPLPDLIRTLLPVQNLNEFQRQVRWSHSSVNTIIGQKLSFRWTVPSGEQWGLVGVWMEDRVESGDWAVFYKDPNALHMPATQAVVIAQVEQSFADDATLLMPIWPIDVWRGNLTSGRFVHKRAPVELGPRTQLTVGQTSNAGAVTPATALIKYELRPAMRSIDQGETATVVFV